MYGMFSTIFYDEEKVQLQSLWSGQYPLFGASITYVDKKVEGGYPNVKNITLVYVSS